MQVGWEDSSGNHVHSAKHCQRDPIGGGFDRILDV
jgi:hypothetical protein